MIKKHIGKIIPHLEINGKKAPYPVINERAIRATAGLMFAVGISTMWYTILTHDRSVMYRVVPIFWLHFLIVTLRGPLFSPISWLGKKLVSNQHPEYVGAIQKRFAWGIGLIMGTIMMSCIFIFDIRGTMPLIICSLCLLFMWLESAVGLCVGCKIYTALLKKGYITQPVHRPACPGGACELQKKI